MALHVYKVVEYDHKAEIKQFEELCTVLSELYKTEDCLFIGNFNIEGVELDSLLINEHGIRIIEFKNWGGQVIARENGAWTANGKIIEGGGSNKSPFSQMRLNRSRVTKGLKRLLKKDITNSVKGCVLFSKHATIQNELSPTVKVWMDVCDNGSICDLLQNDLANVCIFSKAELSNIIEILKISDFEIIPGIKNTIETLSVSYKKTSASAYFGQIEERCMAGSLEKRLSALRDIFFGFVEDEIHGCRLTFSGLFSKVDFLIKENNISQINSYKIHETRRNLFAKGDDKKTPTEYEFLYDLEDACMFISLIKNTTIPNNISHLFHKNQRKLTWGKYNENLLRVKVNTWDDNYIFVTEESSGRELQVCYSEKNQYLTREGRGDWSYMKDMLWKDSQLNLVRLRFDEDICMPELIVFEPDYLINITSIAACFDDNVRHTPFLGIVNKVAPNESSKYIQLGNLSGALLDETVHSNTDTFADSYNKFFHDNIVEFICDTNDTDIEDFLRINGSAQKKNIENLIGNDITRIGNYDRNKVILEPSFFSEVLGIQGRLDFLYQDGKDVVIVEQKSGKGQFVSFKDPLFDPNVPKPIEKHVVQLLLYRALLVYEFQKYAEELKHIFLLYSKYSKGLVSIAQRPELMLEAIKIRNLLAWCEILYTKPGGFKILESVTTKFLRDPKQTPVPGDFFERYKEPGFNKILMPLQSATPLEKAYYFRFQQFLATEQLLSRMGNKNKDSLGFSSVWLDSLEMKKQSGTIYDALKIKSFGKTKGTIQFVVLSFPEKYECDMTKFRKGDMAFMYSYPIGKEPNACAQMVHRGSIMDITEEAVSIRLTNSQTGPKVFDGSDNMLWAIEPDMIESGTSALYRNMHTMLSANKERRNLILNQREPMIDFSKSLVGNYGDMNKLVLRAKCAKDYFLVIGPPGTGKTSHAMLDILQEELANPDGRVLLLSFTNRAVDEMCNILEKANISFMRVGNDLSCGERYVHTLLNQQLQDCANRQQALQRYCSAKVICGTTASINSHIGLLALKGFSLAIIDESSQILEPHLVGLLCAKCQNENSIHKIILIGDHKQLPAVVQQDTKESAITEAELQEIGLKDCRLSLFERLLDKFRDDKGDYDENFVYMLTKQGRMHPDIAQFPNYAFYGNKLENLGPDIAPHQGVDLPRECCSGNGIKDMLCSRYISFIATPFVKDSPSDKVNIVEAEMIAATVIQIYLLEQSRFDKDTTVGVIVPYRNQISTIKNVLTRKAKEYGLTEYAIQQLHGITIDTVERFQGSQRRYILYGFTIQQTYQLNFLTSSSFMENGVMIDRKLNVAMTRAREHLIIFGNPYLLNENPIYYKMMEFIRSKNGYFNVSANEFCEGAFKIGKRSYGENICLDNSILGLTSTFQEAFYNHVVTPLKNDSRTQWPDYILGNSMDVNLTQISYGRIDFSNQMSLFSEIDGCSMILNPHEQVLLYAYYIMRMHYCSASAIYAACKEWLQHEAHSFNGRIEMFDIGCGPATCGLAIVGKIPSLISQMNYHGIDVSNAMKILGKSMLNEVCKGNLDMSFKESFSEFNDAYWLQISAVPTLVLINFSYFFSNVNDTFTERLAKRILTIMNKYPLNKYVFIIQNSVHDSRITSYKTFCNCLKEKICILKKESTVFNYQLNSSSKALPFTYEIWEGKIL